MSGADLAAVANTSAATISRTCQALGFRGFLHLRMLLVRDLGAERDRSMEVEGEGTLAQLRSMASGLAEVIAVSLDTVSPEAFEAAVAAIVSAERMLVVGTGLSSATAQNAAAGFTINGRTCDAPVDGVVQQFAAGLLTPNDVCLAFTSSGANTATLAAAKAAAQTGAKVIALTVFPRSPIADIADLVLVGSARYLAWDHDGVGAQFVVSTIATALRRSVASQLGDESVRARARARVSTLSVVSDQTDQIDE